MRIIFLPQQHSYSSLCFQHGPPRAVSSKSDQGPFQALESRQLGSQWGHPTQTRLPRSRLAERQSETKSPSAWAHPRKVKLSNGPTLSSIIIRPLPLPSHCSNRELDPAHPSQQPHHQPSRLFAKSLAVPRFASSALPPSTRPFQSFSVGLHSAIPRSLSRHARCPPKQTFDSCTLPSRLCTSLPLKASIATGRHNPLIP
jgi:hypothetical protein